MRIAFVASAVVVLIGGSATYALVGKSTPSQKAEVKTTAVETPRLETARLFSAPFNVSPAHASDLIAAKLAPQPAPIAGPEVQQPKAAKRVASKPGPKADPGAKTTKKPKPQQTPKLNTQARKTQASP